jgi:outer membrane receptor protein involved in Fe transport
MTTSHLVCERAQRSVCANHLVHAAVVAALSGAMVMPAWSADTTQEAAELEEITVTGSRIVRRDLNAPSPVVTVSTEQFERSSTTSLESALNTLPQFAPAGSQFVSGAQSGPTTTPGAATLNLRGIGANRNLVLIDGRRPQPANAALVVDINTIPQAAIQGVEVITGGASAVYGPDAIAGVTNFLLKRDFQGLSVDVQTGITEEGDGSETRLSALLGMNAADGKGNIMIGLDYNKRGAVLQRDRDFFVDGWRDTRNAGGDFIQRAGYVATGNPPSQAAVNSVLPVAGVSPTSIFYFNADGSAFVAQNAIGYNGPYGQLSPALPGRRGVYDRDDMMTLQASGLLDQRYTTQFLSTPSERHSLFLKGIYDLNDHVSAFVQANYVNSVVITRGNYAPAVTLWSVSIPRDDIIHSGTVPGGPTVAPNTTVQRTLPAELVTLLNSRTRTVTINGVPTVISAANEPWQLYQVPNYFGALEATNTSNVWQMLAGLNGKMGISDWTWETYFARGTTKTDAEIPMPSLQRYQLLAAAPNFGANAVGPAAIIGPARPTGRGYSLTCTSGLPVFQEFTPSADCLKSMEIRGKQLTTLDQDVFEANMQGRAFDLPAGEARFALGLAYRKNSFRFDPSYPVEAVLDNPIGLFASNATQGRTSVKEIYGELLAPILPGVELELGYRLSDFNTAGTEGTYKALFTWKAHDQVTFRGGYQLATRAPNTAELFAGNRLEVVTFPGVDPCSAATDHLWGNRAENPNRAQVQAICRAMVNAARGMPLDDMTSMYDTQTFNTNVIVNGRLMGPGANGFTRQNPPYFPLEIETEMGNPNLDPETAKTITLGAVLNEPLGLTGLTATVDAYQIRIKDTISRLSSFTAYYNCLNANGTSNPTYDFNNPFCQLIDRNGTTGDRENVDSLFMNLGKLRTRGLDVAVNWQGDIGPGTLSASTTINYLLEYEYQPDPTAPYRDAKGTLDQSGQYDYRVLTTLGYRWGAWDFGLQWRFLPPVDAADKALLPTTTVTGTGSYSLFNLSAGWDLGSVKLRAGIDNVLNRRLPIVGANLAAGDTNSNQTNLNFYDGLGRRFYIGAKLAL